MKEPQHWVFLRGLVRQQLHWEAFPQQFQIAFPEATTHCIDLPGNGSRCEEVSPISVSRMVDVARADLVPVQQRQPVWLLAISLGGMVAVDWMERFPHEVAGAVIINSSLGGMSHFFRRLRPQNYSRIAQQLLLDRNLLHKEQMVLDITSNLYPQKSELALRWRDYATEAPTSLSNSLRQLAAAALYRAPESRPHERVLVLTSRADQLVHWHCSRRMARTWDWPLAVHDQAGHDLVLDDPDWVLQQVQQWSQGPFR